MLKAVICGSRRHIELLREGWRCHHMDSNFGHGPIVYLEPPKESKS